jgi:hypothetical protein
MGFSNNIFKWRLFPSTALAGVLAFSAVARAEPPAPSRLEGIQFRCEDPIKRGELETAATGYFTNEGLKPKWYNLQKGEATLTYTLTTQDKDTDTLSLYRRSQYLIEDAQISLPILQGGTRTVSTASKKEILLALMQHGRLTTFNTCDVTALQDHVGIRQNIAAWAETLEWQWPDGTPANWNPEYWSAASPAPHGPLHEAVNDAFMRQDSYGIGCYTASKLVMVQAVLDYYRRVKQDVPAAEKLEARLLADSAPLRGVEPGAMWGFEKELDPEFDSASLLAPGKLLKLQHDVAPRNFVPGDWAYFLNTDTVTYEHVGYEGSNAIYLGRDRFDDYYNDHFHNYTYQEKLNEVFQWRNKVFSWARDFGKETPLTFSDLDRLGKAPAEGGLLLNYRAVPYLFEAEPLP